MYFFSHCSVQTSKKPVSFSCIIIVVTVSQRIFNDFINKNFGKVNKRLKRIFYLKIKKNAKTLFYIYVR